MQVSNVPLSCIVTQHRSRFTYDIPAATIQSRIFCLNICYWRI